MKRLLLFLLLASCIHAQSVAPIGGLGSIQFIDNNGNLLTNGVLYSYQAGTSTQQATFTDSTGHTQNVNPITFGVGARAQIWLSVGQYYKLVLCQQNDGPTCAASDILFSVDNVPGGSTSSGGGSSPFTGTFISGSGSPSTTGVLRLATADSICWRNAAGSTNLCISKDSNDILTWAGGSVKFPEISPPAGLSGFDLLWADSSAHRWMMKNNGGGALQIVASGVDINTSDQVTQLHFGTTAEPLGSTGHVAGQFTGWNGTNLVPMGGDETWTSSVPLTFGSTGTLAETTFANAHTLLRFTIYTISAPTGCSTSAVIQFKDITSSTVLASLTIANGSQYFDSGALSVPMAAGDVFGFVTSVIPVGCGAFPGNGTPTAIYQ